ncbi:MAG: folylpolyglutamate synthase/dihydrofolate synthase family protein [Gammaproteobacteria bacterium]
MKTRTLPDWLQRIEALHPSEIELGLERAAQVYAALPEAEIPTVISVAGTNGKGSTVECLTRCAVASGLRVGTYTSPHLVRFNERMCLNGEPADNQKIVAAFETVEKARGDIPLTYFEYTTLASLALFRAEALDFWVLEVGLGGRLDAVNIIDADVAIITSIGLDHQDWLGDNLEDIGREKAGIMRSGAFTVCSDPNPPESIGEQAKATGTRLLQLGRDFRYETDDQNWDYHLNLGVEDESTAGQLPAGQVVGAAADHSVGEIRESMVLPVGAVLANMTGALTAMAMLKTLPTDQVLNAVFSSWSFRGRLQRLELDVPWWLDVAHNAESAALLAATLERSMRQESLRECYVVIGMLGDKPVDDVIKSLAPLASQWLIVGLDSPRALTVDELAEKVKQVSASPVEQYQSVAAGLAIARARAQAGSCIVVTGSFHTVGPALAWLGQ